MKINFLGDSITEGALASDSNKTYSALLCNWIGAEEIRRGISGSRIACQKVKSSDERAERNFILRAKELEFDADFTFVFGGTNDFGHGDSTFGEPDSLDPYTFCGALNILIDFLCNKFAKNKICFIVPLHRFGENNPKGEGNRLILTPPLEEYRIAIKNACRKHGIDYLEINKMPSNPPFGPSEFYGDGLHPNDNGHRLIAETILEYLKSKKIV